MMKGALITVIVSLILILSVGSSMAQPLPSAELDTREVHTNFMEAFTATVRNQGSEDMVVTRVSVTIDWPGWAPTSYPIFEGREVIPAGGERVFTGPAIRMPQTEAGTYHAFLAVVFEMLYGQQETRFETSVSISDWGIRPGGVPEYVAVPISIAALMLLITAAFFRLERATGWPPFRAVPRHRQKRRT